MIAAPQARTAHAARQDASHEEQGIVEAIAAETTAAAAEPDPGGLASSRPAEQVATDPDRDAHPDWRTLYKEFQRDWNDLAARSENACARKPDIPLLLMDGYEPLFRPVRALAHHPDLSEHGRNVLDELLEWRRHGGRADTRPARQSLNCQIVHSVQQP